MPTFDGDALLITLDPTPGGVAAIDAQEDLYEPWKDWLLANPLNRRFPFAFESDGANEVRPGLNQGGYIFFRNDRGWRIKFPEQDMEYYPTGNFVPRSLDVPAFLPSDGAFKNVLWGLQPITQGVDGAVEIVDTLLARVLEGSETVAESWRIVRAAVAGKGGRISDADFRYRDVADTKDRIVAITDGLGKRTNVVVDGT